MNEGAPKKSLYNQKKIKESNIMIISILKKVAEDSGITFDEAVEMHKKEIEENPVDNEESNLRSLNEILETLK